MSLEQRGLHRATEGGRGHAAPGAVLRESLLDGLDHIGGISTGAGHDRPGRVLLSHCTQNVQRIEIRVAAFRCETGGSSHELLRSAAHEARDVDAAGATRPEE